MGLRLTKGVIRGCALALALGAVAVSSAAASTFSNPTPIAVPGAGTSGPAAPYPSAISVAGLPVGLAAGPVVKLTGVSHGFPRDLDVLLVGPTGASFSGQRSLLMSDVCGSSLIPLTGQSFTFVSTGGTPMPANPSIPCATASWAPTDNEPSTDVFPSPAPPVVSNADLAAFANTKSNGTWQLWASDDIAGQSGAIAGGWSLELLPDVKCGGKQATVAAHVGTAGPDVIRVRRDRT